MRLALALTRRLPRQPAAAKSTAARGYAALPSNANVGSPNSRSDGRNGMRRYTTHSQLPSEHQMVYEMCRKFADEELAPNAGEWDQKHQFPTEAVDKLVS